MLLFEYAKDLLDLLPSRKLMKAKNDIRNHLMQRRRILSKDDVRQCSSEVVELLRQNSTFIQAKTVMIYYPVKNEIDLRSLITLEPDKTFLLPVVHRKTLEIRPYQGEDKIKRGKLGIPEPQTPIYNGNIDLIIVPAVGYDNKMHRLGRGGGYYDRFLHKFKKTPKIGVGYAFQKVSNIPSTKHDEKVDALCLSTTK